MAAPLRRVPPPPPRRASRSGVAPVPRPPVPSSAPPPPPSRAGVALEREVAEVRLDMDAVLDAVGRRLDEADRRRAGLSDQGRGHHLRIAELEERNRRDRQRLVLLAKRMRDVLDDARLRERRVRQLEARVARLSALLEPAPPAWEAPAPLPPGGRYGR